MTKKKQKIDTSGKLLENLDFSWTSDSIRYINTPSLTARKTFFYVQEVGSFVTMPPYFTERANLDSFLIIYTISGEGSLSYQGRNYTFVPNSIAFINCSEHHLYECAQNQKWEFLWLHFNGSNALGYFEEFMKNGFRILHDVDRSFYEMTMRRILALSMKKDLHYEVLVSGLIVQLLTQILIENSEENLSLGTMPDYIKSMLKIVDKRYSETLTLDRLAEELAVSKYYLAHEFKRYVGMSPAEYIIVTRINHAKELLKYSNLTIEDISWNCGFHQTSYFINQFKKREEMTPLQYRKKWSDEGFTSVPQR